MKRHNAFGRAGLICLLGVVSCGGSVLYLQDCKIQIVSSGKDSWVGSVTATYPPDRVCCRYELESTDQGGQDGGIIREASYTSLAGGKHRFRLNVRDEGGERKTVDAVLGFSVAPAWFRAPWFRILCVAVAFFVVWVLYRVRLRRVVKAMSARFDERLDERTRIARDLHDTFLQTIQGSKLVADSALKHSADPIRMRSAMEQLSGWLGRATEEGRAALNSLRSSAIEENDLAAAFRRAMEECHMRSSMEQSFSVAGTAIEMHPIVRDEVYRIGYEAIRNACAHSHAEHLRVELTYAEDLILRVRDDGAGIESTVGDEGRLRHLGLQGVRDRAGRINAKLTIETSARSGTEIKLIVPGSVIYSTTISKRRKHAAIRSLLARMGLGTQSEGS